tara:strand:+ start:211 stop:618 length:408 start_codon:yes stop_codon:yes gene_type:complete
MDINAEISDMRLALASLEAKAKALETPKQWEPRGGLYKSAGTLKYERRTRGAAEKARDALLSYNRLLAYVDEFGGDWEADWEDGKQLKFTIYYSYASSSWDMDFKWLTRLSGAVHMSQECAVGLVKKLNSGEVVL